VRAGNSPCAQNLPDWRGTSRPESRNAARRGITGITWDERRPATGPSPRTRDQAP